MNYSDIFNFFIIILGIILILTVFIKMPLNIILILEVDNEDIRVNLNLTYMFNIININLPLYPKLVKSKKKELKQSKIKSKKILKKRKIYSKDILKIYEELKKVKIMEFYSNIYIGNTDIAITNFVYLFINLVYGNLINIINPSKFYMNIKPNFIENKIYIDFKIHLKLTIKNIIDILKAIFLAYKNSKKIIKEDKEYESNRVYTKHNGNNT